MLQVYDALARGDASFFERTVSPAEGMLAIGTDPNEWWAGKATFTAVLKAQLAETGGFRLIAELPRAFTEGDIGWVADRPKIRQPDGAEIPLRLTMVFRKEDNDCKLVMTRFFYRGSRD